MRAAQSEAPIGSDVVVEIVSYGCCAAACCRFSPSAMADAHEAARHRLRHVGEILAAQADRAGAWITLSSPSRRVAPARAARSVGSGCVDDARDSRGSNRDWPPRLRMGVGRAGHRCRAASCSIRRRVSGSRVRMVPFSTASSGMTLVAVPAWNWQVDRTALGPAGSDPAADQGLQRRARSAPRSPPGRSSPAAGRRGRHGPGCGW